VDEIERLENAIEELQDAIRRSRRLILAGRWCAVVGLALLAFLILGLLDFTSILAIAGVALALGGLVLMGSSKASTDELERSLKRTEGERRAAIDALELVEVGDEAG
jgi:predicted phage tail protein